MSTTRDLSAPASSAPSLPRVLGIDAARGLAVLGMFVAHLAPRDDEGSLGWLEVVDGRSSALFAVLAGVSLALLSGGATPPADLRAWTRVAVRIAVRAVLVVALGLALAQLGSGIAVILAFYGVYFVVSLPFLRLRTPALAALAGAWAVAGPVVSFAVRRRAADGEQDFGGVPDLDSLRSVTGLREAVETVTVTGVYPAITWMPFVLAGLALGRADLRSVRPAVLAAWGAVLTVAGYGGSWLAMAHLGGRAALVDSIAAGDPDMRELVEASLDLPMFGVVPTNDPWWLAVANPHSGTPFEIIGSVGVAFLVVAAMLVATAYAGRLLRPLVCVGACALSVYTAQVVAIAVLVATAPVAGSAEGSPASGSLEGGSMSGGALEAGSADGGSAMGEAFGFVPSWPVLLAFVVSALVAATVWKWFFRRGPLEWVMHVASTTAADRLVPRRAPERALSDPKTPPTC